MQDKRVYDPRIAHLEEKVSYGTLGILETIVKHTNDPPHLLRNILIINGDTILRNCYDKKMTYDAIIKQFSFDIEMLVQTFTSFTNGPSRIFIYFHPAIRAHIPNIYQRVMTPSREDLQSLSSKIVVMINASRNIFHQVKRNDDAQVFICMVVGDLAYRKLDLIIGLQSSQKAWLVTHCPIDYFIISKYPNVGIILSHTGIELHPKDFSKKVFGDDSIPFNKTTYKLFGDKEFIKGLCNNRPAALKAFGLQSLRLRTEHEIRKLALSKLNVNKKDLDWRL